MSANLFRAVVRHLRDRPPAGGDPSADGELLRRFARLRDAAAFEALVRRHGPMVWGVCRRAVRTHADAEDAYQVTFAVLAARAGAVRNPNAVGCWLYGVAARAARRVRATSARFAAGEEPTDASAPADPPADRLVERESVAALDEELARLPEKYRGPLVLCYLQERTQDEAAGQLRLSLSTLKRRLEAGRQLLRGRLERRGVELSAVLAAASVAGLAPAGLPAATVGAVIGGGVSGPVGALTREVLFAMWMTKVRTWAAGLVVAAGLTGGAGHYAATVYGQGGGDPTAAQPRTEKTAGAKAPAATPALPTAPATAPPLPAPPPQQAVPEVPADLTEKVRRTELSVKLAEIDIEVAENRVAEAKARREAAAASGAQVEVVTAEIALRDAMLEVRKAQIKLDAERESLRRLEKLAEAPARPALPPPPPGTVALTAPATGGVASVTPAAATDEVRKLREQQLKLAEETYALELRRLEAGAVRDRDRDDLVLWSQRVRDLRTMLDQTSGIKAATDHLSRVRDLEASVTEKVRIGQERPQAAHAMTFHRLDAEIAVKQAGGREVPPPAAPSRTTPNAPARRPSSAAPAGGPSRVTRVEQADGEYLVRFHHGPDAGVGPKDVLQVVREDKARKEWRLVGRVRVVAVGAGEAVGRFEKSGTEPPKQGDLVVSIWW